MTASADAIAPVPSTIDWGALAGRRFDAVVVGAGPSGALAARELARAGADVLLVDRARFPRDKVCGSCLSARALAELDAVGLGGLTARLGARPLRRLRLVARGRRVDLPLAGGVSVSRRVLDAALVREAVAAGAALRTRAVARLEEPAADGARTLRLGAADAGTARAARVRARVVVAADGLAGRLLPSARVGESVAADARLGAGAVVAAPPSPNEADTVWMIVGEGGYVGATRLEDGRLDTAAALDASLLSRRGGLAAGIASLLDEAGVAAEPALLPVARAPAAAWHGTPGLTRRPARPGAPRVLAVGDAAGYAEPFTGEGIGWALASGRAVVPYALAGLEDFDERLSDAWARAHRAAVARRQWPCRALARVLRHPRLVAGLVGVLRGAPSLATPLVRRLHGAAGAGPRAAAPPFGRPW